MLKQRNICWRTQHRFLHNISIGNKYRRDDYANNSCIRPFKEGLHARLATELVKICQLIKSNISLIKDTIHVNPKSIFGIMSLGASFGTSLTIEVTGIDEDEGAALLTKFFES